MKRIVVDSTVCVNWFTQVRGKRERAAALELLEHVRRKRVYLTQPSIWREHVTSMLLRKRGTDSNEAVAALLSVDSKDHSARDILSSAAELATSLRADLFDTLYHVVAIDRDIELITSNNDYIERAAGLGHIRLLHDWVARSRIAEEDNSYSGRRTPDAAE